MKFKTTEINGKQLLSFTHKSGLEVIIYKMEDFRTTYTVFGTRYGSIDNCFSADGETVTVPAGIAHFLEHKMFECEDGDAFLKFAKTGAYSNAYTSFDRTCYLFNSTNLFEENLKILLNFVSVPYFTKETVEKEQGIIGQEITMYDDMPNWRVFHNLLNALYKEHPIKIDIPGTKETIAKITDKLLYSCYNTFYTPSNMFLVICGDVDENTVAKIADQEILQVKKEPAKAIFKEEPKSVCKNFISQKMEVLKPLFAIGFKDMANKTLKQTTAMDILVKILAGETSNMYKRLIDEKLIDDDFTAEYNSGRGFAFVSLEGASDNVNRVCEIVLDEIEKAKQNGISEEEFNTVKKGVTGIILKQFNNPEQVASMLVDCAVKKVDLAEELKIIKEITLKDVTDCLEVFKKENYALSIIE